MAGFGIGGPLPPTQAQPVSGSQAGTPPALPTVVSVQGIAGGTPVDVAFPPGGTTDVNVVGYGGVATTLGQKTMAASIPTVIASNQSTLPTDPVDRVGRLLGIIASITAAVDVSDRVGRLLGVVASITAPVDVSDRIGRLLGVVASITAPVDVSDRIGRLLGITRRQNVTNTIIVTGGANAIATATLPAAGVGNFHYITHIHIARVNTAALAGGAILTITTTNLGARAWRTNTQRSITISVQSPEVFIDQEFVHPIKSAVANTATTIVCPAAGAAVSWHMVIDYYTGV